MNDATLLAFLEESLPVGQMTEIEKELRQNESLRARLLELVAEQDNGVHSIGEIWKRHRLSCPSREELGSYLLGAMPDGKIDYIQFHLDVIRCQFCRSNLEDLSTSHQHGTATVEAATARRRKFFQSSVGRLKAES